MQPSQLKFLMKKYSFLLLFWGFFLPAFAQVPEDSLPVFKPHYAFNIQKTQLNNNIEIAYADLGKKRSANTIVFIHGLGGTMADWTYNIIPLSKYYRCIAIDLPGYGASGRNFDEPSGDYMDFYSDVVIELIDKLGIKYPILAGHSMGGQVAIAAVVKAPSKFSKLILVAPAGIETFTTEQKKMMLSLATPAYFKSQSDEAIRETFATNFLRMPASTEALIQDRIAMKKCQGFDRYCYTLANGLKSMLDHPVFRDLDYINLPTLIIFGKNDKLIPNRLINKDLTLDQLAQKAHQNIRPSQITIINDAGHFLQFEKPVGVNSVMMDFVVTK